jgi:hypothetical protein
MPSDMSSRSLMSTLSGSKGLVLRSRSWILSSVRASGVHSGLGVYAVLMTADGAFGVEAEGDAGDAGERERDGSDGGREIRRW